MLYYSGWLADTVGGKVNLGAMDQCSVTPLQAFSLPGGQV